MESLSSFNFATDINSVSKPEVLIKNSLSKIPTHEMRSFVDRINFYINHFDILTRKNAIYSSESKVTFLKKLKTVIVSEIDSRKVCI